MKIVLNVPYEEKELVKALHARWDKESKSWYIPDGIDYHLFQKWIDPKMYQSLETPLSTDDVLLQYQKIVSSALGSLLVVVVGDVCRVFSSENNVYTNFDLTNDPTAKQRIYVYADQKLYIPSFDTRVKVTGTLGVYKDKLQVKASDIRPLDEPTAFKRTLAQWKKDYPSRSGLQKQKIETRFGCIGVIAPKESAGYNDFITLIGEKFEVKLLSDVMTAESMSQRIQELDQKDLDCICIVRGGGSIYDFLDFNHPKLIQTIYEARHPIAIGVGHSTDELACNDYADLASITPSKLADDLIRIKCNSINKKEKPLNQIGGTKKPSYTELLEENAHLKNELNHLKELFELETKRKKGFFSRLFS